MEQMDVSEAAADVVRCVRGCGQRFGQSMIAGTLLGENTGRIRGRSMDKSPSYGKQSKLGKARMQDVIRAMVERGYLRQTKDKYMLLKLTERSEELIEEGAESFIISYKKEEKAEEGKGKSRKAGASGRRPAQTADLTESQQELFEEMRKLRMRLAGKRKIPPYCGLRQDAPGSVRQDAPDPGGAAGCERNGGEESQTVRGGIFGTYFNKGGIKL